MYIVGITGPTGAGKTAAMRALEKDGALALDCDEIYHALLESNSAMTDELKARFPSALTDSKIDRKKLGSIVFSDKYALSDLNDITHKYVSAEVDKQLREFEQQGGDTAAICAIALIECGISELCDSVICILAPKGTRIERLMKRDNIERKVILTRMNAQQSDDFYIENSNYALENTYTNLIDFEETVMNTVAIDKWFDGRKDEMIAELGEVVAINSVRGQSEDGAPFGKEPRRALKKAQDMLEKHGLDVSVFEDMVITSSLGPEPAELGILAHLDIVEAGKGWDTDPFTLTEKDGKLYGRGAMDNKGPAIASMYAAYCVRELAPKLKHGFKLILGSSEETGFDDIAQYMAKNKMPPNVFSPDSEFPVVNVEKGRYMPAFSAKWEKDTTLPRVISVTGGKTPNIVPNHAVAIIEGISEEDAKKYCETFSKKTGVQFNIEASNDILTVSAKGKASHASRPKLGNNAQTALIEMLAAMPFAGSKSKDYIQALARLFPHGDNYGEAVGLAMEDEISGKTTVCFSVLSLDEHGFTGNFDARTAICADKTDVCAITKKAFEHEGITVSKNDIKSGHHTPADSPFVQTLLRIFEEYTGEKGKCNSMGGLTYVHDVEGGVAYGCNMPGEDNGVHGPNEFFDIEQLIQCSKMFARVILEICS